MSYPDNCAENPMSMERGPAAPIDVAQPQLFQTGEVEKLFSILRRDTPVCYRSESAFGPYWSITRHTDIEEIELDVENFSSAHDRGGITIDSKADAPDVFPMFISMDPPQHGPRRRVLAPAFGPTPLQRIGEQLRCDARTVLDSLPQGQSFDWVDRVAIELTALNLAALLDFPREECRTLVRWSDVMSAIPGGIEVATMAEKVAIMEECFTRFHAIWRERKDAAPSPDLISMLAKGEHTKDMTFEEFCGTMMLLIVAGNETTRNSISGSLLAMCRFPDQYAKLVANPGLLDTMVPEVMRWQTAVAHMRRTATRDIEFRGSHIRAGDKVILWYLSANRDEAVFDEPERFIVDRPNARRHLAFGHGIHHCLGARLGELQVRVLWEAMLERNAQFDLDGEPVRTAATFINGYESMPVRLSFRA